MGLGMRIIINHELLKSIKKTHSSGIYSADMFLSRVKIGETYFTINEGEGGIGPIFGPYKLINVDLKMYESECLDENMPRLYKESKGFIKDLFWGAKACFKDRKEAERYRLSLMSNEGKIFGSD